jgi:excisionase family DNA binding protein
VLDARQVAELLHLPISTALDFARRGVLPAHKIGRRWIFLRDEIEIGVRDAPNRSAVSRPQPPGQITPTKTDRHIKRYPEAVPSNAASVQTQLFC